MGSGPTQPTETYFDKGLWGYDGAQWRKLPLLWGYSDRWAEQTYVPNAAAGTNYLALVAVPAGYIYRLDALSALNVNTASTVEIQVVGGGIAMDIVPITTLVVGAWKSEFPIGVVLKATDYVLATFGGCTLNDDLYLQGWGVKMAVG